MYIYNMYVHIYVDMYVHTYLYMQLSSGGFLFDPG